MPKSDTANSFQRASSKSVRRRRGRLDGVRRAALAAVATIAGGFGVVELREILTTSGQLAVETITFAGTTRTSPELIVAISGSVRGANIFGVDLQALEQDLRAAEPWIRSATLRRALPNRIEVGIDEYQAVARLEEPARLVSSEGVLLPLQPLLPGDEQLPLLRSNDAEPQQQAVRRGVELLQLLASGRAPLADRVSHVEIGTHDLVVRLLDADYDIHIGSEDLADRLNRYRNVEPLLRARYNGLQSVDLRFPNRVVVSPVGKRVAANNVPVGNG